jgi:hypothetical protein
MAAANASGAFERREVADARQPLEDDVAEVVVDPI